MRARALVEAGDMGGGDGWKAMEDIVKNNVRWFIYNKTNLLKQVISGNINLSNIESFDKCHLNREANVQGFQMQRSAVGQMKLDIASAISVATAFVLSPIRVMPASVTNVSE